VGPSVARFHAVERMAVERNFDLAALRHLIEAQAARVKLILSGRSPFLNVGGTTEGDLKMHDWVFGPGEMCRFRCGTGRRGRIGGNVAPAAVA